jgi:hypothetical protein
METKRIVCHFSCGAASAVATKLAIERNAAEGRLPLVVIYCHVVEEHPDNMRFLRDCEQWFGVPILILQNQKYGGSIYEVFRRDRFIASKDGAPCTKRLKKEVGEKFAEVGDVDVFGFTVEEQNRLDRMIDANANVRPLAPLIDGGLHKGECLAILARARIELPVMYRMGYDHNNCIGCVKAGAWYWNKIRVDFPETFARMSALEQWLGHPMLRVNHQGVFLKDLAPNRGRRHEEPKIECGIMCELAERDIYAAGLL